MEGGSKEQCGPGGLTREKEKRVCGGGKEHARCLFNL